MKIRSFQRTLEERQVAAVAAVTPQEQPPPSFVKVSIIVVGQIGGHSTLQSLEGSELLHGADANELAKQAKGDFLLFLKPHVLIDAKAIALMREDLERDLSIAAVAPKMVDPQGRTLPTEFIFVEDECRRRPIDVRLQVVATGEQEGWRIPPGDIAAACCDSLMVRKTAFWAVGGWTDEASPVRDINLCLGLREQHWRTVFDRDATVVSSGGIEARVPTVSETRKLVETWYGKFLPHSYRTSDGVYRNHPWWPIGYGKYGVDHQRVQSPFETAPSRTAIVTGAIPGERCSVVIVTYNSAQTIQGCLASALEHSGTFDEILVVDNASRDATPEYLRSLCQAEESEGWLQGNDPRLKVLLSGKNLGFSEGSNLAIRAAQGEYVVLLNPDTEVPEGWLGRMRHYFEDPRVGAVGPLSNYVAGLQQVPFHFPSGISHEATPAQVQQIAAQVNSRRGVESKLLIGFCMMLRKSALDEVGLLDSDLFLGCDDLDMSWRLRQSGYRLIIASDVFVLHEGHVSFNTDPQPLTDKLNQDSCKHLAKKLEAHYAPGPVPSSLELWGIDWFRA